MLQTAMEARTTRLLYWEIFWSSILGGIVAFNSAYVVRLGAAPLDISLLSALPALAAIFVALPAGRFLQSRARPSRWALASLAVHWSGYLLLAFVPWVHPGGLRPSTLAVLLLVSFIIPAHIFGVGIHPLLADVVPEQHRLRVFSVRQFINSTVVSTTTFVAGLWLNRTVFPGNYQLLYALGWLCGMLSVAHLVRVPFKAQAHPAAAPAAAPPRRLGGLWPSGVGKQRDFVRIVRNTFLHSFGLWLAGPLYILQYVRVLGASDAWLGLHGTVTGVSTIVGLLFWRWAAERLREARTLRLTILSVGVFPLLVGLVPNLNAILLFDVFNGFFIGGINVSHINVLLKTLPEARRTEYMGLYAAVLNAGAFVCPLVSVALANWWGVGPTLVVCGVLALAGSCAHWLWPVPGRPPEEVPVQLAAETAAE